jgi:hypothetical protein
MDEEAARIIAESYATLERLDQREKSDQILAADQRPVSGGHFDPVRAALKRRAVEPEPEVIVSEPVTTPLRTTAIEQSPPTDESESEGVVIMEVLDEMQGVMEKLDRKLVAMQAEINELKSDRSYRRFSDKLDESIRTMNELAARFDRGHERSGQVIDLPPLPTRNRTGMN